MKKTTRTVTITNTVTQSKFAKEYTISNQPETWEELEGIFGGFEATFEKAMNYFDFHGTRDTARRMLNCELDERNEQGLLDWNDDENVQKLIDEICLEVDHGQSPSKADKIAGDKLAKLVESDEAIADRCNDQAEKVGMPLPESWMRVDCAKLKMHSRLWKRRQVSDPLADF